MTKVELFPRGRATASPAPIGKKGERPASKDPRKETDQTHKGGDGRAARIGKKRKDPDSTPSTTVERDWLFGAPKAEGPPTKKKTGGGDPSISLKGAQGHGTKVRMLVGVSV